jgi:type III secretion protein R
MTLLAQAAGADLGLGDHSLSLVIGLAVLSLLPFAALTLTSFVKIAVVLSIARSAIGTQQLPPTPVLTGLAIILSAFVMAPVADSAWTAATADGDGADEVALLDGLAAASEPLTDFLVANADPEDLALFLDMASVTRGEDHGMNERHLLVAAPAFVIGELRDAFRIGFLVFLPFLVVDLVVSSVLLALGMHMLSPTTVSLPFKLLLFVAADGWALLAASLVQGYLPA